MQLQGTAKQGLTYVRKDHSLSPNSYQSQDRLVPGAYNDAKSNNVLVVACSICVLVSR